MTRPIIALSVAIAASVVVSGCAYLINHWPHQRNSAPASRQYRSRRTVTHESLGGSDETTTPVSEASPSPSTAPGSPAGLGEVKPTVTIGSDENDRTEAERLLNEYRREARESRPCAPQRRGCLKLSAGSRILPFCSQRLSAARLSRSFEPGEEGVRAD